MDPRAIPSGARLTVVPRPGAALLLPVSTHGCLEIARDLLSCGDGPDGVRAPLPSPAEGAGPTDSVVLAWLAGIEPAGSPSRGGVPFEPLARDLVVGRGPPGAVDVPRGSWERWAAAGGSSNVAPRGAAAWRDRLRGGDFPEGCPASEPPLSLEGSVLAGVVESIAARSRLVRHAEAEVAAARLESIRELAYGAGHEINNPLANIATRAQTLLVDEQDPERRRRLSTIVDQAFRARDLIGGLMLFARPPRPQVARHRADALVAAVVSRMAPAAAARGVTLEHRAADEPLEVAVDSAQVEEAIRAIVANALEAVVDGGSVTIRVAASGATSVDIEVRDDGRGMDAATVRRAFDPFFSGREAGRGAGLGLSKALRFVEASGGAIRLESRPGKGTVVTVTIPLAAERGASAPGGGD